MKHSSAFLKLMSLARIARAHVVLLANTERYEVGEPDWNTGNVTGYCGIGTRYLERLANDEGIHPVFCVGVFKNYNRIIGEYQTKCGHAWIKYQNYIIDITATQFSECVSRIERDFNKPVYVCKATNPHFSERYVGPLAKDITSEWYIESLDELCEKTKQLALESKLKFPSDLKMRPRS